MGLSQATWFDTLIKFNTIIIIIIIIITVIVIIIFIIIIIFSIISHYYYYYYDYHHLISFRFPALTDLVTISKKWIKTFDLWNDQMNVRKYKKCWTSWECLLRTSYFLFLNCCK